MLRISNKFDFPQSLRPIHNHFQRSITSTPQTTVHILDVTNLGLMKEFGIMYKDVCLPIAGALYNIMDN